MSHESSLGIFDKPESSAGFSEPVRTEVTVVQFTPAIHDPAEIAALHLGIREWQIATDRNRFPNILDSRDDLMDPQGSYMDAGGTLIIAQESTSKKVVGIVGLENEGNGQAELKRMGVAPEHQRQGVGSALMEGLIEFAVSQNFREISLTTGLREDGQHLYRKFGFKPLHNPDGSTVLIAKTGHPEYPDIPMVKDLTKPR